MKQEHSQDVEMGNLNAIQAGELTFEASLSIQNGELCIVVHDDLGLDEKSKKELLLQTCRLVFDESQIIEDERRSNLPRPSVIAFNSHRIVRDDWASGC